MVLLCYVQRSIAISYSTAVTPLKRRCPSLTIILFPSSHLRPTKPTSQSADHGQESERPSAPHPAVWPLKSDAVDVAAAAAVAAREGPETPSDPISVPPPPPAFLILARGEMAVVPTAESAMR